MSFCVFSEFFFIFFFSLSLYSLDTCRSWIRLFKADKFVLLHRLSPIYWYVDIAMMLMLLFHLSLVSLPICVLFLAQNCVTDKILFWHFSFLISISLKKILLNFKCTLSERVYFFFFSAVFLNDFSNVRCVFTNEIYLPELDWRKILKNLYVYSVFASNVCTLYCVFFAYVIAHS